LFFLLELVECAICVTTHLVRGRLREWFRLTIVIITHDLDSLWRIADRVAILGNGKVLGMGSMSDLSRSTDPLIHEYFYGPRGRAAREQAWNRK